MILLRENKGNRRGTYSTVRNALKAMKRFADAHDLECMMPSDSTSGIDGHLWHRDQHGRLAWNIHERMSNLEKAVDDRSWMVQWIVASMGDRFQLIVLTDDKGTYHWSPVDLFLGSGITVVWQIDFSGYEPRRSER